MLTLLDKQLLNNYQQEFPLSPRPYQTIAEQLGVTEEEVLIAYSKLAEKKFIGRIGLIIHISINSLIGISLSYHT